MGNAYSPGQMRQVYWKESCCLLLEMTQLQLARSLKEKMGLRLRRPAGIHFSCDIVSWHGGAESLRVQCKKMHAFPVRMWRGQ